MDGTERKVTSISSGALEDISGIVIIPASYTSITDSAAGDNSSLTVAGTAGSAAEDFAKAANLNFLDLKKDELPAIEYSTPELDGLTAADSHSPIEWEGYSFGQSDTYRKNLASNTNIVVFGSELAGVCGILFILLNLLLTFLPGKKRSAEATGDTPAAESRAFSFLKIAVAVTVSGLLVTTVNTFILRAFIPAWSDRELIVLLIPRIAEELIVRLLQAYIISLLYGAVSTGKAGNILKKLQ